MIILNLDKKLCFAQMTLENILKATSFVQDLKYKI